MGGWCHADPVRQIGTTPLPIVLTLHSLTIDYRVVQTISGMHDVRVVFRFIVVSPSGRLNERIPYRNAAPVVDNIRKRSWPDCDATTILYIVDNGDHAWPGKPQPAFEAQFGYGTTDIDAASLLFEFFLG